MGEGGGSFYQQWLRALAQPELDALPLSTTGLTSLGYLHWISRLRFSIAAFSNIKQGQAGEFLLVIIWN